MVETPWPRETPSAFRVSKTWFVNARTVRCGYSYQENACHKFVRLRSCLLAKLVAVVVRDTIILESWAQQKKRLTEVLQQQKYNRQMARQHLSFLNTVQHRLLVMGAILLLLQNADAARAAMQAGPTSGPLASLAAVAAATPSATNLPIPCPPPTANGTFPFPLVTSNFCGSLGLSIPKNPTACFLWGPIQSIVAYSKGTPLGCDKIAPSDAVTHPKGFYIPQPLPNRIRDGRIPDSLPLSVLDLEGATYYWLYMNRLRFASWAACGHLGDNSPWQPPQDWKLVKVLTLKENLTEVNVIVNNTDYPIAVVLKQGEAARKKMCMDYAAAIIEAGGTDGAVDELCSGGHLVVMIRGTGTSYEGDLDFDYNLVSDRAYGDGLIHKGFRRIANDLWDGGFKAILDREFVRGRGVARHLTINGHSLGGGTSKLLAARAEKYLEQACANRSASLAESADPAVAHMIYKCKPTISLVTFAAPNAGNSKFVRDFNKRINARTMEYKDDFVAQVPCSPTVTTCSNAPVPTYSPQGYLSYAHVGGRLMFDSSDMPVQEKAWSKLSLYRQKEYCDNADTIGALQGAVHVCAYLCKIGSYTNSTFNWCMLWPAEGDEAQKYSYCFHGFGADVFPITNPLYPPDVNY